MNKPEFTYVDDIFGEKQATVVCITNTITFNPIKTKVYFDAICKNGVYRFTAKIGRYEDGDEFMPDHKWWCDLRKDEYHTLTVNYAWLDKEPVALWVE